MVEAGAGADIGTESSSECVRVEWEHVPIGQCLLPAYILQ